MTDLRAYLRPYSATHPARMVMRRGVALLEQAKEEHLSGKVLDIYTVPIFRHVHEAARDFYRYAKYGLEHPFQAAGFEVVRRSAASGFWITFGSEWSYYLRSVARGPLRFAARALVALNNAVFPWLDRIDRRLHRDSEAFTWMYLFVARKPA